MCLPLLSSLTPSNPEEDGVQKYNYCVSPCGRPHKQKVGKPSQNAAQPCAKAEGCVHDDLRADKLQKGWGFRVDAWNVDSLTGRAGELIEWRAFKEHAGEVVVAGFLELKAKDISCSGWEVRRELMV